MTFEQFEQYPDDAMKHELIQGEHTVVPPPTSGYTTIQHRLAHALRPHVLNNRLGEVYIEAGFKLSSDTFLQPAISFLRQAQFDATDPDGYFEGSPAVTVEVFYQWNTPAVVSRKIELFIAHGAEEVWVIDDQKREVVVHKTEGTTQTFASGDLRSDLFPGWSMEITSLFQN